MATILKVGAMLAALSGSGFLAAQIEVSDLAKRLAVAKVHESRGELALAEQDLRTALDLATPAERAHVATALAVLLVRQGRSDEATALTGSAPQEPAKTEDPIQRLIAVLNSGVGTNEVKDAAGQLGTLGSLVVPHLLAALPKLGPFGTNNVLDLLVQYDDPRITAALGSLLDTADAVVVTAIAGRMERMRRAVALPLAQRMAQANVEPMRQLGALRVLLKGDAAAPTTQQLAQRLAADPAGETQLALLQALDEAQEPWLVEVFAALMQHGSAAVRTLATFEWIRVQQDLTEARALAAIEALPPDQIVSACRRVGSLHPDWLRVGLLLLRTVRQGAPCGIEIQDLVQAWEWWRMPDESGAELLAMPFRYQVEAAAIVSAVQGLVSRGWVLPASLDGGMARLAGLDSNGWALLASAVPADAEDRALAMWETAHDATLVSYAIRAERPWHRLVARHLLQAKKSDEVSGSFLQRDWRGAPPEALAALAELAARWPESPSGGQLQWHGALIGAFGRHPDMPNAVILPLVKVGNGQAWQALVERDPQAALECARGMPKFQRWQGPEVARLLRRHGDQGDIPFALRALAMVETSDAGLSSSLLGFFAEHAAGHLDLIRLACVPVPPGSTQAARVDIACQAAKGARVEDLAELLELMPSLQPRCWNALVEALSPPASIAQVAPWIAAVEACLAAPWTRIENESMTRGVASADVLLWLVWRLGDSRDPSALPVLRRVLALEKDDAKFMDRAAMAALQCAGPARRQLLIEMLASPNLEIVRPALAAPEQRTDAELRQRTRDAVLRLGETLDNVTLVFDALDEPDRIALALAVLDSDRFARFSGDLCTAALKVVGQAKDVRYLPQLARGVRHPNSGVRSSAAMALGNTFAREAAPHLLEMLKDDSEVVRQAAQKGLDDLANYLDARAKWEARLK